LPPNREIAQVVAESKNRRFCTIFKTAVAARWSKLPIPSDRYSHQAPDFIEELKVTIGHFYPLKRALNRPQKPCFVPRRNILLAGRMELKFPRVIGVVVDSLATSS
jgi:hypothetical protein